MFTGDIFNTNLLNSLPATQSLSRKIHNEHLVKWKILHQVILVCAEIYNGSLSLVSSHSGNGIQFCIKYMQNIG